MAIADAYSLINKIIYSLVRYYNFFRFFRMNFYMVILISLQQLPTINLLLLNNTESIGLLTILSTQLKNKLFNWFYFIHRLWTHFSILVNLFLILLAALYSKTSIFLKTTLATSIVILAVSENIFLSLNVIKIMGFQIYDRFKKKDKNTEKKNDGVYIVKKKETPVLKKKRNKNKARPIEGSINRNRIIKDRYKKFEISINSNRILLRKNFIHSVSNNLRNKRINYKEGNLGRIKKKNLGKEYLN